jgi:uncharacterized membrane protein
LIPVQAQIQVPTPQTPQAPQAPQAPTGPQAPTAPTNPNPQAPATPDFLLRVCHAAAAQVPDVFVAIVSVTDQKQYRAQGWWKIPKTQCVDIGKFIRPGVFMYGMAGANASWSWSENDASVCVNMAAAFDYSWDGNERKCAAGEAVKNFFKVVVPPESPGIKFSLN